MLAKQTNSPAPESIRDSESRQTNKPLTSKRSFLLLFGVMVLMIGFMACDSSITSETEPKSSPNVEQFFSFNADSVGPLLEMAIDTLRARQTKTPFVRKFIAKKGLPVWDAHSAYHWQGNPVLQVPVRAIAQKKITGLFFIEIQGNQPLYGWVARGTAMEGVSEQWLETVLWGYAKKIFGKIYTDEGARIIKKTVPRPLKGDIAFDAPTDCYTTCVDGYCGEWHCPSDGEGVPSGGVSEGPGNGGDDGGGPPHGGHSGGGDGGDSDDGEGNSTKQQLKNLLEDNEFALLDIPCGQIPEWQGLAQHEVPNSVMNRMDDVLSNYKVQKLENAEGAVVNMDYFAVTVSANEIPHNWTASEYLTDIRLRINQYTDGPNFEPYPGLPNERNRWLSDNPLGSLLSIQLFGNVNFQWLDDGTVVTSGFNSNTSSWTFTTLYTPEDDWHPVSGNRTFGFTNNGDGTITFFTRGVDRLSNNWYETFQNITGMPFNEADNLWQSFQQHIANYFDNATIEEPITYRPDYSDVEAVLNEQAPVSSLGCN